MRPGNSDFIILRIPVKTHKIFNQRRFVLPCPLYILIILWDTVTFFDWLATCLLWAVIGITLSYLLTTVQSNASHWILYLPFCFCGCYNCNSRYWQRDTTQRAYLSKLSVDVALTLVDVYRSFQNILTLTLERVSFKSQNVNVTSSFWKADPSILLVDVCVWCKHKQRIYLINYY